MTSTTLVPIQLQLGEVSSDILYQAINFVCVQHRDTLALLPEGCAKPQNSLKIKFQLSSSPEEFTIEKLKTLLKRYGRTLDETMPRYPVLTLQHVCQTTLFAMFRIFCIEQPNSTGENHVHFDMQCTQGAAIGFMRLMQENMQESKNKGEPVDHSENVYYDARTLNVTKVEMSSFPMAELN